MTERACLVAFVSALLALACGPDTELSVYAEADLAGEAGVAIDVWNAALSRGPCYGVRLYPVADEEADIVIVWGDAHGWLAETISRRIELRRGAWIYERKPAYIVTTIAHELGHALGVEDQFDERSKADLMWWAPAFSRGPEPTGWDVARVCQYFERAGGL